MTLSLILTLMTAAAVAAVVWPFAFGGARNGGEVVVYKDQLVEIDRDREAGLIGTAEAEAARIEVSRRLLRAAEAANPQPHVARQKIGVYGLTLLTIALIFVPAFAGGLYLRFGSPGAASAGKVADQTAASSDNALVEAMVAQVEGYLKDRPNDGRGWETLAPVYMHLGRYDDSARAWQNAIASLGASADREGNLGESLVAAANGVVTDEAKRAFDQALAIDRSSVIARFYIGLAAKQDGQRDEAARIWRDLLAAAPPDAGWVENVRDALAELDEPSVAATGAASPPDAQQDAMIRSMVAGLAERLAANGEDPDGWLRLVRSYNVLGDRDKAAAAVTDARHALASDPDNLARFEAGLKDFDHPPRSVPQDARGQSASAGAAPPEHDNATMQAMVDKLAERLRAKGGDVDSWLMLVRSYDTLGEHDKAVAAVAQARAAFASDPDKLSQIDQILRDTDSAAITPPAPQASSGPKTQQPAIAAGTSAEQLAMIKGMVEGLAERLKRDGHDVDGWIRLMRSYVVLGQPEQASAAGRSARVALGNDSEALRRLTAGAKELGVDLPEN